MTRVFWNQWEKENRLALLDAEAFKPLNGGVNKSQYKRMIEESDRREG
jgi:hypothetical protein